MSSPLFDGEVALVTGAARGIGLASAEAFAAEGARVVLADIDAEAGEAAASRLCALGADARFFQTDVTRAEAVEALVGRIVSETGRLDVVHNNAGIATGNADIVDASEEEFDRVIALNLKSVWLCMKYAARAMLAGRGGAIVNSCSALGLVGAAGGGAYVASKHGVAGLTKSAALEYAARGIRVNAVCPGIIRTDLIRASLDGAESERALMGLHPIGRLGDAAEVAAAVVWLASSKASFTTGSLLGVDGGWTTA